MVLYFNIGTCSNLVVFIPLQDVVSWAVWRGGGVVHMLPLLAQAKLSKPRQVDAWADLTCTVTAVLLELMHGGHGNRRWERRDLSLWVAVCISFAEALLCWLLLRRGSWDSCLPCTWSITGLIVWELSQKNKCAVFNLEVVYCIMRGVLY